jgi:alkanesulfonate monooxygenase SsuD/methylene tetrahydromethanopterin reductase-like flavin-dependent oxidoreductase (luciferase family)
VGVGNGLHEVASPVAFSADAPRRLRLGFLTHLHVGADAANSYSFALELFEAADELGYDTGWVAQHHFENGGGRLPSTLAFLAAAAQRTRRIGLGTAIIILPLEDPLRVAEDAAVVDTLSNARLQLGLGTGGDPLTFAAFHRDVSSRRERYAQSFNLLKSVLRGDPIRGTDARLYPPVPTLADRIWESTLSQEGGARIGRHGSGLLLARTAFMSDEPTDRNQLPVAQAYFRGLAQRETGRLGLSRAVYPAEDKPSAMADLDAGVLAYVDTMIRRGFFPTGLSPEAYYARSHIHYGHPEEVIASLRGDVLLPHTTDLICQVHPGHPTPAQMLAALERTAREVAPALGWHHP